MVIYEHFPFKTLVTLGYLLLICVTDDTLIDVAIPYDTVLLTAHLGLEYDRHREGCATCSKHLLNLLLG